MHPKVPFIKAFIGVSLSIAIVYIVAVLSIYFSSITISSCDFYTIWGQCCGAVMLGVGAIIFSLSCKYRWSLFDFFCCAWATLAILDPVLELRDSTDASDSLELYGINVLKLMVVISANLRFRNLSNAPFAGNQASVPPSEDGDDVAAIEFGQPRAISSQEVVSDDSTPFSVKERRLSVITKSLLFHRPEFTSPFLHRSSPDDEDSSANTQFENIVKTEVYIDLGQDDCMQR